MSTMKKVYLVLSLFCCCLIASAQNTFIRDFRFPQSVTISDGNPAAPNVAPFIRKLAEGNNKSIRATFFTIAFDQTLRINTREPDFVYRVENSKFRLSGDISYKGFEVSDLLIPVEVRFELRLKRSNGSLKNIPLTAVVNNERPEATGFTNTDTADRVFTDYAIVNPVFRFSNSNEFEKRISIINDYYRIVAELEDGFLLLQTVAPADLDRFRANQKNLTDAANIYASVKNRKLEQQLPLQTTDPARFIEKSRAYEVLLNRRQQEMTVLWNTLHLTFYDRGITQMKRGNLPRAVELFYWALEVNPGFSPALLRLAEIDYERGDLHEATCKADDILLNFPADPVTRQQTFSLLDDIHLRYVALGNKDVSAKNFARALDHFETARQLCLKYRQINCSERLTIGIAAAKSGIFNDLLDEARDFIVLNDLDRAESSTKAAISYQENNPKEVRDGITGPALLQTIRQKKYDQLIQKAMRYTDQRNYTAALTLFEQADQMYTSYQLSEAGNLRELVLMAARPRALELLYEGTSNVKINRLSEAKENYRTSVALQQRYGLLPEADLKKHSESLRNAIFSRECLNAQQEIDAAYNRGQQLQWKGDYLAADAAYARALNVKNTNPDCGCTTDSVEAERKNILPAVTYLDLMNSSRAADESGNYQRAIDRFLDASTYFAANHVGTFGLDHQPDLFIHIRNKGSNGLLNYAGDYYRERGELEHALELYKLLLARGYSRKALEGSLYQLGDRLARRDFPLNQTASWKELVLRYTNGDKNLKRLRAGYKKGFKR